LIDLLTSAALRGIVNVNLLAHQGRTISRMNRAADGPVVGERASAC